LEDALLRELPRPSPAAVAPARFVAMLALLVVALLTVTLPVSGASASTRHLKRHVTTHRHVQRRGGRVQRAWPHGGRAPRTALARWLARQVGPVRALPCARRPSSARRACGKRGSRGRAVAASVAGNGAAIATAAAAEPGVSIARAAALAPVEGASGQLALVRSYEIPVGDPSYERLLNWAWTYDSAVTAAAFVESGNQAQAKQLLDQLTALQNGDGSIDFAFDVATGAGVPLYRSGTIAWVGLAAAAYDQTFKVGTYLSTEKLAANYLLSLQGSNGLIRGGPDVKWVSTQHNLIAYAFLARLGSELAGDGETSAAARYQAAAAQISAGIAKYLFVQDTTGAWFREGVEDNVQSLDVQALGAMYLQGQNEGDLGKLVLTHAQAYFALGGRSISLSSTPATYNMSYSAAGPFAGFEPYLGTSAPEVLWFEGTAEMRMAAAAYGQSTAALDASMTQWEALTAATGGGGVLQSNQTITSPSYGVEYHVWPAAAAWVVLSQSTSSPLSAPLPAGTTLVSAWSKVRGGNYIATPAEGVVDMTGSGERRALAGAATGTDYTVTADVTYISGEGGYGIFLRASAPEGGTSYVVQVDHGFGEIIVRERQAEQELSTPLARAKPPAGYVWYGQPHLLSVTIQGNALTATMDGTQVLNIPSLTEASAFATARSTGLTVPIVPPLAGSYGLRAWNVAQVDFQQVTAGPVV
jgi:hypothetical protein